MATLKDTIVLGKLSILGGIHSTHLGEVLGTSTKLVLGDPGNSGWVEIVEDVNLGPSGEYGEWLLGDSGYLDFYGGANFTGAVSMSNIQIDQLKVRTTSSTTSTTYGPGVNKQILTSNGTNAYWNSQYLPYQYHYRYHFQVSNTSTSNHNTAYFSLDEYSNGSPKSSWTNAEVVAALTARGFTGSSSALSATGAANGYPVCAVYAYNGYVYCKFTTSSNTSSTSSYGNPITVVVKIETVTNAMR